VSEQLDMVGVPVDYARPPEELPTPTKERAGDWLAKRSAEHSEGWRRGVIEGALWCLAELDALTGAHALPIAAPHRRMIEDALRRRFGAEHVDRRIAEVSR
jgi:hypothetical protein